MLPVDACGAPNGLCVAPNTEDAAGCCGVAPKGEGEAVLDPEKIDFY
jgi:hypothetical protein